MPTISVIVPVYKVEPYIHQCIDSILAQTYTDFELILVDDGSPDNCGLICDEYEKQDDRIRVIHQKNQGLSAARNAGIDIAKGEYLTFIDSDDLVTENYLERLYQLLIEYHAEISVCDMYSFQDGEEISGKTGSDEERISLMAGRDACLSIYRMDGKVPIMACGKLYCAKLFAGLRYPVGMIHEDDATTPKLLYNSCNVVILNKKLYLYRQRADSIMSKEYSVEHFDAVRAIDSNISFLRGCGADDIVEAAEICREKRRFLNILEACHAGMRRNIPKEYRISEGKAIRNLKKILEDEKWDWYLYPYHPKLVVAESYRRKLRKMLYIFFHCHKGEEKK